MEAKKPAREATPKRSVAIFQHCLKTKVASPVRPVGLVEQSESISIKAIRSNVRRANPKLASPSFINRVDIVLAQSFDFRKGGELFAIEAADASVSSHVGLIRLHTGKPDIPPLILQDVVNSVAAQAIVFVEMCKGLSVKFESTVAVGSKPKVAISVVEFHRWPTVEDGIGGRFLFDERNFEFDKLVAIEPVNAMIHVGPDVSVPVSANSTAASRQSAAFSGVNCGQAFGASHANNRPTIELANPFVRAHPQISVFILRKARDNGTGQSILGRKPCCRFSIEANCTFCSRPKPKVSFLVLVRCDYVLSDPVGVGLFQIKSFPDPFRHRCPFHLRRLFVVWRWHHAIFQLLYNGRVNAAKLRKISFAFGLEKIEPFHGFGRVTISAVLYEQRPNRLRKLTAWKHF